MIVRQPRLTTATTPSVLATVPSMAAAVRPAVVTVAAVAGAIEAKYGRMLALKAVAAWFAILVLAVLNGAFRETVLLPHLSKPAAFVLSGLLLSSFILVVAIVLARWLELRSRSRCMAVGFLWLCLTLVFEFGFGRAVEGRSWAELLEAYTFKDGNIWPVVVAVTFLAPLVAAHFRRSTRNGCT